MVKALLTRDGYAVFPHDPRVADWARAACEVGYDVLRGDGERRHGNTWFVGVDALPNAPDGSVAGVPLAGEWLHHVKAPATWHAAQLSVVFRGYPRQDPTESDAAHRFRRNRDEAHVDGLLSEGAQKWRHLREPHGFFVGVPLNDVAASPLVVWRGSHLMMRSAFQRVYAGHDPSDWGDLDVTEVYQTARRVVFETCQRVPLIAKPGQAILIDRHLLYGVATWDPSIVGDMRMVAYFRP
ncbi:MAG: hypothetical protein ACJAVT_001549 [Yoonia sp.]|jgi:hypothetical protein